MPTQQEILEFFNANSDNPAAIQAAMAQYGISAEEAAQVTGGIAVGGQYYTPQQVKDFYAAGGNDNQFAQEAGITDPDARREAILNARTVAGGAMAGEAGLQNYFKQYQQYNPNGAFANNFSGWVNDLKSNPAVYNSMMAGTYTGSSFAAKDWDAAGIYGPGTGHDFTFEQGRNNLGAHGTGGAWNAWTGAAGEDGMGDISQPMFIDENGALRYGGTKAPRPAATPGDKATRQDTGMIGTLSAGSAAPAGPDVSEWYRKILGREPDAGGLGYWQNVVGAYGEEAARAGFTQAAKKELGIVDYTGMTPEQAQAAHTQANTMTREQFIAKYGKTFVADDKGGNASSEVAGQDVGEYYDKWLSPTATGMNLGIDNEGNQRTITAADTSWGGGKYGNTDPYFDAWDNVNAHPKSSLGNGLDEAWKAIGRPIAVAAGMYYGAGALNGMMGATGAAEAGTLGSEFTATTAPVIGNGGAMGTSLPTMGAMEGTAGVGGSMYSLGGGSAPGMSTGPLGDYTLGSTLGNSATPGLTFGNSSVAALGDYTLGSALGSSAASTSPSWLNSLASNIGSSGGSLGSLGGSAPGTAGKLGSVVGGTTGNAGSAGGLLNSVTGSGTTGSGFNWGSLLGTGANIAGGLLQQNAATDAARTQADAQIRAAQIAADAAKFRPVGVTTNFGASKFGYDANGNLNSAGYILSPEMQAQQQQLMAASGGLLNQFTNTQQTADAMKPTANAAIALGNKYLTTNPQDQAAKYMNDQMGLLAPGRASELSALQAQMQAQGRGGFAMGGGVNGQGAANPQLQALYNARMQQDAQLAAQATQGGMDYAKFGLGLAGSGGDLMKDAFSTQGAALDLYKNALGNAQTIEGLGQNAMDIGINLGAKGTAANAQAGLLTANGMTNAANTMAPANAYSPWGALLAGAAPAIANYKWGT